jgi:hypothetical protein
MISTKTIPPRPEGKEKRAIMILHLLIGINDFDENITLCGGDGIATQTRVMVTCRKCRRKIAVQDKRRDSIPPPGIEIMNINDALELNQHLSFAAEAVLNNQAGIALYHIRCAGHILRENYSQNAAMTPLFSYLNLQSRKGVSYAGTQKHRASKQGVQTQNGRRKSQSGRSDKR